MSSTGRAGILLVVGALAVAGIVYAAYLHERDKDAIRTEATNGADASADAHATAAKKPAAKKKKAARGGKTRISGRPGGGGGAHSNGAHPPAPHEHPGNDSHDNHGGADPPAPPVPRRHYGPPSGPSYETAVDSNNHQLTMGAKTGPDLSDAQLSGPMSDGTFVSECGAPDSMGVTVKVAIKMGKAVGVSVATNPPSSDVAHCIDHHVRALSWPASPKMDSFVTTY